MFRYDDDSLRECLEIVCHQPERAYAIAEAGMTLRDDPRFRFGGFRFAFSLSRGNDIAACQKLSPYSPPRDFKYRANYQE